MDLGYVADVEEGAHGGEVVNRYKRTKGGCVVDMPPSEVSNLQPRIEYGSSWER